LQSINGFIFIENSIGVFELANEMVEEIRKN